MAELYTCYSPKGEKFELTRQNYLDCIQHFGFTPGPKDGSIPEAPAEPEAPASTEGSETASTETNAAAGEGTAEDAAAGEDTAEDANAGEGTAEDADADKATGDEPNFDTMDKEELKDFLRTNFPDAEFDGRASRDALADLAFELTVNAEEAAE